MQCFVAIDFETANYDRTSACAVGVVRVENNLIVHKQRRLINPKTYFLPDFTRDYHGLAQADVADAPEFDVVWQELLPIFEGADFIAAHNCSFDKNVLYKCCEKYEITPPKQQFICSLKIARQHWRLPSSKLNCVCEYLGIELDHHEALSDAIACAKIVIASEELALSKVCSKTV